MLRVLNTATNGAMDDILDVWIEEGSHSLKANELGEVLLASTRVMMLL